MATEGTLYYARAGQSRSWKMTASGDTAEIYGHTSSIFVDVDTGASDTVTVELSPNGVDWFAYKTYTVDTVEELPPAHSIKATWSAASKVYVLGNKLSK